MFSAIVSVTIISSLTNNPTIASAIPQPIYPANHANTNPDTDPPLGVPSFSWSEVTGANIYRLQVNGAYDFNQPVILDITTRNLSYVPQSPVHLLADGEWYWRVRVEDPAPVSGWSPIMHFTKTWATSNNKPQLIAPAEGESVSAFDAPAFSWMPISGAATYRFQIVTSLGSFDIPFISVDTLSTAYQPTVRLENGIYYWRVIPIDTSNHLGIPSTIRSFLASYGTHLTNGVPTLISPGNESTPTFTPTFHWTAIEGAELYRLEYTSANNCDFDLGYFVETPQTYYSPTETFTNGNHYCWRVRAESGAAVGEWSEIWQFQKHWDLVPELLTPTDHYQTALYPIYSWTPVPGASRYIVQISQNLNFSPLYEEATTANTTYASQVSYYGNSHYWWRVKPVDGSGNDGIFSEVSEYQSVYTSTAPSLIAPLYYYQPNIDTEFRMNPTEDRTVAYPIFQWHRVMNPPPEGGIYAMAYRLQVDDTPYFISPIWEYDTENTSATPVLMDNFKPAIGQDYYWRVCPLDQIGGECLTNTNTGFPWWSQVWKARFDYHFQLSPTLGQAPSLLRPAPGQESVEATPMLEWWPYEDATQYQVEVSLDASFSTSQISETVDIPVYSPVYSLAQRSLGRINYGTYYWRVRGLTGNGWSDWSDVWYFEIASQSEWRYTRTPGRQANRLIIADDPAGDITDIYDLTSVYASQSNDYWFLGFDANISTTNMAYVFYIDNDNIWGSGANAPPPERDYAVSTIPEHQPEHAIYLDNIQGVIDDQNVWIYSWDGTSWGFGKKLVDVDGSVYINRGFIELKLPNDSIGMSEKSSGASIMLFSVNTNDGTVQDTVPADPEVPGDVILSRFSAVSDRMNLIYPTNTITGDPSSLSSIFPFSWDWPTGSNNSTPIAGSILQVDLDPDFTDPQEATSQFVSNTSHFSENNVSLLNDISGDETYYWRVRPRYWMPGYPEVFGAWTNAFSFHRIGFTAQNLHTSANYAAPVLRWDIVEGAERYRVQVARDNEFGSVVFDITTPMNSFTPVEILDQGIYYWRVQVIRYGNINSEWSPVEQFTLRFPSPTGLIPDHTMVNYTPTLCWEPPIGYELTQPVFTSSRVRVQVSNDPEFNSIFDQIDTYHNCWTPVTSFPDGTYYWHVAVLEEKDILGAYSQAATFTKQYPMTTLISPINKSIEQTPTFIWTTVDGAARYIVEVSLDPSYLSLIDSVETINTQFTPTKIYDPDLVYFWRVAIRDQSGSQGPYVNGVFMIGQGIHIFVPNVQQMMP